MVRETEVHMAARPIPGCFACGPDHPSGLRLSFALDHAGRSAHARTVLDESFAGADGIAHGGIVAALLDEAMVYASRTVVPLAATARLNVRYRHPVPVGIPLEIDAAVLSLRHRAVRCHAFIRHDGAILAEAEAALLVATANQLYV
jgi:acyl-coenzyme A thioesterase PaaI-like protein